MASTYTSLHFHLVFSTKNRDPIIAPSWKLRFHEYLGGTVKQLEGTSLGVGGTNDHVHLLVGLKATHCLADFMRDLKKAATKWVQQNTNEKAFTWQEGYAAITVSPTALEAVREYILKQEEHHKKRTFREELVEILIKARISFDERYLD